MNSCASSRATTLLPTPPFSPPTKCIALMRPPCASSAIESSDKLRNLTREISQFLADRTLHGAKHRNLSSAFRFGDIGPKSIDQHLTSYAQPLRFLWKRGKLRSVPFRWKQ